MSVISRHPKTAASDAIGYLVIFNNNIYSRQKHIQHASTQYKTWPVNSKFWSVRFKCSCTAYYNKKYLTRPTKALCTNWLRVCRFQTSSERAWLPRSMNTCSTKYPAKKWAYSSMLYVHPIRLLSKVRRIVLNVYTAHLHKYSPNIQLIKSIF